MNKKQNFNKKNTFIIDDIENKAVKIPRAKLFIDGKETEIEIISIEISEPETVSA